MGRIEEGISATRRSVLLDPLNEQAHGTLGEALLYARRYEESLAAFQSAATIDANSPWDVAYRGLAYYGLGKFQGAISSCAIKADNWLKQTCRAVAYDKLGRHSDSEAVLMMMKAESGDSDSYLYALIYAQRGDVAKALKSPETAFQLHDAGLAFLKVDPLLDPLRREPGFQAIERALKFPD